ncbi:MAG: hypothetical protein CM15mP14_1930 [Rhodospirillaceae bacterium]|nr:MAG: hypothetical protein CM15mP14_1930 [Rhodospirillaceae bacterium]
MKKILIASKASYVVNELMQILLKNFQLTIYNLFYFNWILKIEKLRIIIGLYLKKYFRC